MVKILKNKINIQNLFNALDEEMRQKLSSKIDEIYHPTTKGGEVELNWIGLLRNYLPERYSVDSGFVVDNEGNISDQIDIIIYDRHFTPFIFRGENVVYIPAEGVYAVFEVRPKLNKTNYKYAVKKLKSVKRLKRTTASFVHILGKNKKKLFEILGGILTKENGSQTLYRDIKAGSVLSFVLCLDCGIKVTDKESIIEQDKKTILAFFLLKLIEKLRTLGSAPALDVNRYLQFFKREKTK
jgi:hypothetical protein